LIALLVGSAAMLGAIADIIVKQVTSKQAIVNVTPLNHQDLRETRSIFWFVRLLVLSKLRFKLRFNIALKTKLAT
jgi:hypothetical protein